MTALNWRQPDKPRTASRWADVLAELQEQPGEWAEVYRQVDGETEMEARGKAVNLVNYAARRGVIIEKATRRTEEGVVCYARVVKL